MNAKNLTALAVSLAVAGAALAGPFAGAARAQDNHQKDKNNMRNIGIAAGAGAIYEGIHGRGTHALILGAGAAYAGKKYEDARKAQAKNRRARYSYRARHRAHRG